MWFKSWFQRWKKRYIGSIAFSTSWRLRKKRSIWRLGLEELEGRVVPTAISWTGADGNLNWNDPLNWSPNAVPNGNYDVTISTSVSGPISLAGATYSILSLKDTSAPLSIP